MFQRLAILLLLSSNVWGQAHPNLVAWYKGDRTALDSSGNGNHGTWVGTEAYDSAPFGAGFEFDGASYATIPNSNELNPTNAVTVAAWIKASGVGVNLAVSKGNDIQYNLWGTDIAFVRPFFRLVRESEGSVLLHRNEVTGLTTNQWFHVAVSVNAVGGTSDMYINGRFRHQESFAPDTINTTGQSLFVGGRGTQHFDGLISDVRIYNAALHPSDIRRVMQGKQPLYRY